MVARSTRHCMGSDRNMIVIVNVNLNENENVNVNTMVKY